MIVEPQTIHGEDVGAPPKSLELHVAVHEI
jgi:hypothetical protein